MKSLVLGAVLAAACFGQSPAPEKVANPAYRALVQAAQAHIKRLDIQRFRAFREAHPGVFLIDVRETEEWAKGRADGAIHISKVMIEHDIEATVADKNAAIVLYCHSGARSALAAENLMKMGYSNVYSLDGGITAYEAAGLATEK